MIPVLAAVVWLAVATFLAVIVGKAIRLADKRELTGSGR